MMETDTCSPIRASRITMTRLDDQGRPVGDPITLASEMTAITEFKPQPDPYILMVAAAERKKARRFLRDLYDKERAYWGMEPRDWLGIDPADRLDITVQRINARAQEFGEGIRKMVARYQP